MKFTKSKLATAQEILAELRAVADADTGSFTELRQRILNANAKAVIDEDTRAEVDFNTIMVLVILYVRDALSLLDEVQTSVALSNGPDAVGQRWVLRALGETLRVVTHLCEKAFSRQLQ